MRTPLIRFFREILSGNGKWGGLGDAPFGLFFSMGEGVCLITSFKKKYRKKMHGDWIFPEPFFLPFTYKMALAGIPLF
jgi:hypothetical protein